MDAWLSHPTLQRKGRLVVMLPHLGFAQDAKLGAEVPGIDALTSGHTQNRLYRPVWVGSPSVPMKCGSKRQKIEIDAIQSLQQLFSRGTHVRGSRRGSVVAI